MSKTGKRAKRKGRYLYAITAGSNERAYGSIGIDGGLVYTMSDGVISAVVSDVPNEKIRPERRNLAAHQGVLRRLMEEGTPLPISFGIIADGPEEIRRILSLNQKSLLEQIHRVAGKGEMGLRITWDVPNIFEYFVQTHPELREVRNRYFGRHREPTHEEKIEVGQIFERILNEDRDIHAEKVEAVLSGCCFESKRGKCRTEREVMNLACLVGRKEREPFEAGVFEAARGFDDNFTFDYSGPWAPHNFVDVELRY